jgi:hypothetical protein
MTAMSLKRAAMLAMACMTLPCVALGGSNAELDLIPDSLLQEESKEVKTEKPTSATWMLDNVLSYSNWRSRSSLAVPGPRGASGQQKWADLLQIGVRGEVRPSAQVRFAYDTVLLTEKLEHASYRFVDDAHLHVKEAYASVEVSDGWFLDAGRINFRGGVGIGFNPTDYFRTNAQISHTNEDPSQLRTNRLGTVGARVQKINDQSAWSFVYTPKVSANSRRGFTDEEFIGLNLNRTNDRERVMVRYARTFGDNFAPEAVLYWEDGAPHIGGNLSYAANQNTVLYVEGDVGHRRSLLDETFLSFRENGILTPAVAQAFPDQGERSLKQFNIGASYTNDLKVTFNAEFHYNEAGMTQNDWRTWFATGGNNPTPQVQAQLLSVKQLGARLRQEPLSRSSYFLRANWPEAIWPDLTLTAVGIYDKEDNSWLTQLEAAYALASGTSAKLRYVHFVGNKESNFGSNFVESTIAFQLTHIF